VKFSAVFLISLSVIQGQHAVVSSERPSAFELLNPASNVVYPLVEGIRQDNGAAHAVVTVLAVEDSALQALSMRGIRIDLSAPAWRSVLYMEAVSLNP
jgi:hypothetical protein